MYISEHLKVTVEIQSIAWNNAYDNSFAIFYEKKLLVRSR